MEWQQIREVTGKERFLHQYGRVNDLLSQSKRSIGCQNSEKLICWVQQGGSILDANKFGLFLAQLRKEQNMTQAELASKLQVTDKAVSRWERGIGLPDISTLESLSEALQVTVLELLKSERLDNQEIASEEASETVMETIKIAIDQQQSFKKRLFAICIGLMCIIAIPVIALFIGSERFPYDAFFLFLMPLYILCAIEYQLYKRNTTLAILMPIVVAFSGVAFGLYAVIIGIALLTEFLVMQYVNRNATSNKE